MYHWTRLCGKIAPLTLAELLRRPNIGCKLKRLLIRFSIGNNHVRDKLRFGQPCTAVKAYVVLCRHKLDPKLNIKHQGSRCIRGLTWGQSQTPDAEVCNLISVFSITSIEQTVIWTIVQGNDGCLSYTAVGECKDYVSDDRHRGPLTSHRLAESNWRNTGMKKDVM